MKPCAICRQRLEPGDAVPWQHPDTRLPNVRMQVVEYVHRQCVPPSAGDENDYPDPEAA